MAFVYFLLEDKMLKKNVVRDGQNRMIGSVTSGYAGGSSIVRDAKGHLLGFLRNSTRPVMPKASSSASTRRMADCCSETMTNKF